MDDSRAPSAVRLCDTCVIEAATKTNSFALFNNRSCFIKIILQIIRTIMDKKSIFANFCRLLLSVVSSFSDIGISAIPSSWLMAALAAEDHRAWCLPSSIVLTTLCNLRSGVLHHSRRFEERERMGFARNRDVGPMSDER